MEVTRNEFVKSHAETLQQVDFFSKMVITKKGLRQAFVLSFLHVRSRRVFCSPATFKPYSKWMASQAEGLLKQANEVKLPIRYLVRDRDSCYTTEFRKVFEQADVLSMPTAPRAPNQNAFLERWIGSLKYECLNQFICFGLSHLDFIVSEYASFYNEKRPHQRKDNVLLTGTWLDVDEPLEDQKQVVCETRLGEILKHCYRVAA